MNISFSTPKVNLINSNGYGHAGLQIVKSLTELGHVVPFQDPSCPVQLNFSQPTNFKLHRKQYQIGYTPWESTVIPQEWFENMAYLDEIWTTSEWCKKVFEHNGLKVTKVFPHGIDPIWSPKRRIIKNGNPIKFLHIGEPAPRKAGQMVVDAFIELFGNDSKYSLTIKAYNGNTTRVYNNKIDRNILGLPNELFNNIQVITDNVTEKELVKMYHDHDVLVYPTYGEGFGFIPLQALATGMPVISTYDWADYKEFLGPLKLNSSLIDSPWPFPHAGKVYEPEYNHLIELMQEAANNFNAYSGYYYAQSTKVHEKYNWLQLTNNAFADIFKKFN